jgi:acyl-CoA synthetase (AMP-forming)/AMP-acid ligase II
MALIERSRGLTVSDALLRRATADPQRPFCVAAGRELTFEDIEGRAAALAASLQTLGIEAGDRVAVVLPRRAEFLTSVFALAKLRAVIVPVDPGLPAPELRYMLRHSEAVCAITVERHRKEDYVHLFEELFPLLPDLRWVVTVGDEDRWYDDRTFRFEDLLSAGAGRDVELSPGEGPNDVFAIFYTSGTMGKPKGVELTHTGVIHAAAATAEALRIEAGDRVIGVTALSHVFGLGPGVLGCVLSGASLLLQEEVDPAATLDLIETRRATVHYGVPTVFTSELQIQRREPRDLSSLRVGLVAGGPMGEGLVRQVERDLCPNVLAAYSLTETSSTVSITRLDDSPEKRRFTVGRPIADTEVRVLEEDGSTLPPESLGELAVRGPGVMHGYYRQPGETGRSFGADGFFRTGDLGMVDEEGYVHLVGRRKEVIIRSGSNVYPREVEDRLQAHPAVSEAVVVGVEDELLGEAVCASVVPVEGAIVTADELREWCRRTLADYKVPDLVRFFDSLPMTGTGKVRRIEVARLIQASRVDPAH